MINTVALGKDLALIVIKVRHYEKTTKNPCQQNY